MKITEVSKAHVSQQRPRLPRRRLPEGQRWVRMKDGQIGVAVSVPFDADELQQLEKLALNVGATVEGLAKSIALSVIGRSFGVAQDPAGLVQAAV